MNLCIANSFSSVGHLSPALQLEASAASNLQRLHTVTITKIWVGMQGVNKPIKSGRKSGYLILNGWPQPQLFAQSSPSVTLLALRKNPRQVNNSRREPIAVTCGHGPAGLLLTLQRSTNSC